MSQLVLPVESAIIQADSEDFGKCFRSFDKNCRKFLAIASIAVLLPTRFFPYPLQPRLREHYILAKVQLQAGDYYQDGGQLKEMGRKATSTILGLASGF